MAVEEEKQTTDMNTVKRKGQKKTCPKSYVFGWAEGLMTQNSWLSLGNVTKSTETNPKVSRSEKTKKHQEYQEII